MAGATQTLPSDHHQQLSKSISHSKSHTLGTSARSNLNGPHRSTLATTILVIASTSLLHPRSRPLSLSRPKPENPRPISQNESLLNLWCAVADNQK